MPRILLICLILGACQSQPELRIEPTHSMIKPAQEEPAIYHPGWISTDLNERDAALSPDGQLFFYTLMAGTAGTIVQVEKEADGWGTPQIAPFSGSYNDLEPFFTPDGSRLYFVSNRPLSGQGEAKDYDIWYVDRTDAGGWGDPINIGSPVNTEGNEFYPSISRSGALYYTARMEASFGGEDLYRAVPDGQGFAEPENLGEAVNTSFDEFNAFIDPDEQYILYSSFGRPDGLGGGDLYISRKDEAGNWQPAENLGAPINSSSLDYCPFVAADGTFWFSSRRSMNVERPDSYETLANRLRSPGNGAGDIYWMREMPEE